MHNENEADGVVTGINVTPLVDIMMVLLIVFMVTAHFATEGALKIHLPAAAAADAASAPSLRVTLNAKGETFLLEHRVDANGLRENLEREARANPAVRVTLAADQSLSYREIVALLDLIKKAGVSRVALAAQP